MTTRSFGGPPPDPLSVTVLGSGPAATTATEILRAVGVTVDDVSRPIEDIDLRSFDSSAVVLCDVIELGCDSNYVASVARRSEGAWITLSAFGLDGPLGGYAGSDLVCAAMGGMMTAAAASDGRCFSLPGDQALRAAGQAGALAALHAVSMIREGRAGVHLDVSAQESVAYGTIQQECAHLLYACGGAGGASRYLAPSGVYTCTDGDLGIIVIDDHQWERISGVLGKPSWPAEYPRLSDRLDAADAITHVVSAWAAPRSKFECEALLQAGGVAAIAIRTVAEARSSQPPDPTDSPDRSRHGSFPGEQRATSTVRRSRKRQGLGDLRVAEVTNVLAGPLAGAILAAMGAEVVRLEDEQRLDVYRRNGPFLDGRPGIERGAYFQFANHSKRSVLRRADAAAQDTARLGDWADVLLENVGAARIARLGVDQNFARAAHGGARVSISGFGRSGPYAAYKAYALNVHAFAGLTAALHDTTRSDATLRASFADYGTAMWAATIAAAWWLLGSPGRTFDLSMAAVIIAKLSGFDPSNTAADPVAVMGVIVRCEDGTSIAVSADQATDVRRAAKALDIDLDGVMPDQANGIAFLDIGPGLEPAEAVRRLRATGLSAYTALRPADVLQDAQLAARGFIMRVPHPELGTIAMFALPWKEAFADRTGYRRAPLLGEDDSWFQARLAAAEPDGGWEVGDSR